MEKNSFYTPVELKELGVQFSGGGGNIQISRRASIYGAENIRMGDHVRIDDFCILSGNIVIGNYVHIASYCALYGGKAGIVAEDFTGLSSRCAVYAESDDYSGAALTNPTVPEQYRHVTGGRVVLKRHVIVGTGASILPGVTIGEGSAVGSMSLVTKSLEDWGIYAGIPCRRIKDRSRGLLELERKFAGERVCPEIF